MKQSIALYAATVGIAMNGCGGAANNSVETLPQPAASPELSAPNPEPPDASKPNKHAQALDDVRRILGYSAIDGLDIDSTQEFSLAGGTAVMIDAARISYNKRLFKRTARYLASLPGLGSGKAVVDHSDGRVTEVGYGAHKKDSIDRRTYVFVDDATAPVKTHYTNAPVSVTATDQNARSTVSLIRLSEEEHPILKGKVTKGDDSTGVELCQTLFDIRVDTQANVGTISVIQEALCNGFGEGFAASINDMTYTRYAARVKGGRVKRDGKVTTKFGLPPSFYKALKAK